MTPGRIVLADQGERVGDDAARARHLLDLRGDLRMIITAATLLEGGWTSA